MLLESDSKNCFSDIILGYSTSSDYQDLLGVSEIFIKHFNSLELAYVNNTRRQFVEEATRNKIPSVKEKEEYILKEGLWTEEKNAEIKSLKDFAERLLATKKNLIIENQVEQINQQIKETHLKLQTLEVEKRELIGFTIESYADKKINEFYVKNSLFTDRELTKRHFSDEDFENVDDFTLKEIVKIYNQRMSIFSVKSIRKMIFLDDYFKLFVLCGDNPYYLHGKPIIYITHFQIEAFHFARQYKTILNNSKTAPPQEVLDDPDKLDDWYNLSKNTEKLLDKQTSSNAAALGVVGASKKDLDRIRASSGGSGAGAALDLKNLVGKSFTEIAEAHGY